MTWPGEGITIFTSPYLTAGAPALGEAKGLIKYIFNKNKNIYIKFIYTKTIMKYRDWGLSLISFSHGYFHFLLSDKYKLTLKY